MAKTKQANAALPSLRRLADDAHAHEQIREAIDGLASASQRIARKRGRAAEDKKLYANLGQAATSLRNATRALQRRKPEPTRRGRKIIAVVALGSVIALVISQRDRLKSAFAGDASATAQDSTRPRRPRRPPGRISRQPSRCSPLSVRYPGLAGG
jgi:hypothetical protein